MALTFKSPPRVTHDVVSAAAATLEVEFPADYADFLLNTNGGVPKPRTLMADAGDYKIEQMYSLSSKPPAPAKMVHELVPMNLHFRSELELPRKFVALGLVDERNVLLLTVQGDDVGTVSVWSFIESRFQSNRVEALTTTFSEFLKCLEQPSDRAKARAALRKQFASLEGAIINEKWAKVRTLVAALDMSLWNPGGTHPVFHAIECREAETVKQLHEAGIPFDIKDHHGQSPRIAAEKRFQLAQEVIPFLIGKGGKGPFPIFEKQAIEAQLVLQYIQAQGID